MKLPEGAKPSKVPLRGRSAEYRPILGGAQLEIEEGVPVLYVTNSYTYLRLPISPVSTDLREMANTVAGPIPRAALQHMERGVEWRAEEGGVRAGFTTYDRVYGEATPSAAYPEMKPLVPPEEKTYRVAINPRLLADLAAGMGASDGVVLIFNAEHIAEGAGYHRVLTVEPVRGTTSRKYAPLGLMMPIREARP